MSAASDAPHLQQVNACSIWIRLHDQLDHHTGTIEPTLGYECLKGIAHQTPVASALHTCESSGEQNSMKSERQSFNYLMLMMFMSYCAPHSTAGAQSGNAVPAEAAAEYRRLYAIGDYAGAVREAQVNLQEQLAASAPDRAMAGAYHDLGRAQLRAGQADQAILSLNRTLELLELTEPVSSDRFVGPLVDLAEAYTVMGTPEASIVALQRAIAIGRQASGLFNSGQMELLDRLAASYESVSDIAGVDYARRYAVRVAEQQFGADDPRILPALEKLAHWFERIGRYAMAIELNERIARISSQESEGRNAATINALLGVGRNHRLAFVETPELVEHGFWGAPPGEKFDPVTGKRKAVASAVSRPGLGASARPDRRGEDALLQVLEILESVPEPPPELLAQALLETGDWYQTEGRTAHAISYYRRAWPLFERLRTESSPNPLLAPRPMFYRLPAEMRQNHASRHGRPVERSVEFQMSISATGQVSELVRTGGDMTEGEGWQVARTLNRAIFSPRFEAGEPAAMAGFVLIEYRYDAAAQEPPVALDDGR